MMENTPSSNVNINPPPPASSMSGAASNPPFTPRSTTFPDNLDSDSEDMFEPTPVHSPGGTHYDDLPPTYDEAQQQALSDARNGIPPFDPNSLEVHRLRISENSNHHIPAGADVHAHRATTEEAERENRRNGSGLRVNVPVQQVRSSEHIPVGKVRDAPADPASVLLSTALEFTKHEPDADARYAPRLTRCVAIPQEGLPVSTKGKTLYRGYERRGSRGRGRKGRHVPGQWPDASNENLPTEGDDLQEPTQFLRAYAKALHAHSIRPAEFLDFLDGLNAICAATGITPSDLTTPETTPEIVKTYISGTNETFFAPRGLKVSIKSLSMLLDAVKIPEERGQRAGAIASVLDDKNIANKRAQALHPWIEALETTVPEPSTAALMVREMGERIRHPPPPPSSSSNPSTAEVGSQQGDTNKTAHNEGDEDPPHSIPGAYPGGPEPTPTWPSWGGCRSRGSWEHGRCGQRGPFGPPGHGPFGPPGHTRWGPPGFGPFGPPGHGPWGNHHGRKPVPGFGPGPGQSWQEWGQNIGKWGEEFGKKMEVWGQQFGKTAEEWGNDFGKRAGAWGEGIAQRAGGNPNAGPSNWNMQQNQEQRASEFGGDTLRGQETGVHHEESSDNAIPAKLDKKAVDTKHPDDDDNVSVSSDSSSDCDCDSDSDFDDDEKYPDTEKMFIDRIREINLAAEASMEKGKKSLPDIERDRALAIEKAEKDKAALETKIEVKRTKRAVWRDLHSQKRSLKREHRHTKRTLKQQGFGKKSSEWKALKKDYKGKKGELRKEKQALRRDFREAKWERKRAAREKGLEKGVGMGMGMVWVVVENLV